MGITIVQKGAHCHLHSTVFPNQIESLTKRYLFGRFLYIYIYVCGPFFAPVVLFFLLPTEPIGSLVLRPFDISNKRTWAHEKWWLKHDNWGLHSPESGCNRQNKKIDNQCDIYIYIYCGVNDVRNMYEYKYIYIYIYTPYM